MVELTSVQDDLGICDAVSIIPICDDGTYLLVSPVKGKEIHWIFTGPARNVSWRMTARQLILDNIGYLIGEENLVKVFNIWLPDGYSLHHAVFEVVFSIEMKKRLRVQNPKLKARWFTAPDIHLLAQKGTLRSPEIIDYLPALKKKQINTAISAFPEGYDSYQPYLTSDDGLVEIFKEHIFVQTDIDQCNIYEQLVKLSNLHRKEQVMIYREFLSLCFPNLMMIYPTFETFMSSFGWKQNSLPNLFHAADLSDRGALTFRDFLYILAACEPKTPHGGRPAEIRCRYIFRYFDVNRDNRLDYDELKQMLITIRLCRNMPVRTASIEKELDTCNRDLGLPARAEMNVGQFMRCVGDLKFRGTSSLLRSPQSVIEFFLNRSSSPYTTIIDTAANQLFLSNAVGSQSRSGVSGKKGGSAAGFFNKNTPGIQTLGRTEKKDMYEICGHVGKVCRDGLKHMDVIDEVPFAKTHSVTEIFMKSGSMEIFNTRFAPNEIIAGLRYFTERIDVNEANMKKMGRKPKPAYNWGQVDFNGFANCLMSVCDMVAGVVAQEPRLLRVAAPVYVMGDLHGNFADLHCFESLLWKLGPHLCPCNLLFLGDYVDRGINGVEVIAYLFSYKLLNSKKVHLIRGNHEIREVQKMFTFLTECQKKFGKELGYQVWNTINKVFDNLPVAAIIDDKIFCCHGGIPPPWLCPTVESINSIPCPLSSPEEQSSLAWEILWNDPIRMAEVNERLTLELQANEGFAINIKRGTAHMFNINALQRFLGTNELSHVIRAHEAQVAGFQIHQTGKLLTVFSSSHYCGGNNEAACILVFKKELRIFRIDTA